MTKYIVTILSIWDRYRITMYAIVAIVAVLAIVINKTSSISGAGLHI